jgi:L-lysine 6-transaminase
MTNVRGRGLMCAFDLPNQTARDDAIRRLHDERVLGLACGERSIRFRPALNVTTPDLEFGLAALDRVLS